MARGGAFTALVLTPDLEIDSGTITIGEILRAHDASHPVGVSDVVETTELAVELPEPRIISHPVGAEMDQPGLAHAPVVV